MELVFYWIQWETRGLVEFIYNFWHRPRSLFLTPIPNLCILFNEKIEIEKEKKKVLFHGKCLQPLEFLPSFSAGLTAGRRAETACTKRVVPLFPHSAAGSYILACAYFVRLHARIVWLTDTRLDQQGVTSPCIHGCLPEWTSLAWLEKEDPTVVDRSR